MKRIRRAWPGVVALAVTALALPLLAGSPAQADGTNAGPATIAPTSGTSATAFTLSLPAGAACAGDTASANYTVTSYVVPAAASPATLTFDPLLGPNPTGVGPGSEFRQPLFTADTGEFYTGISTANASSPGGPGPVVNIPQFKFAAGGYTPGQMTPGAYNIGIACTKGPAGPTQLDRYWNTRITVTANSSGGPSQISFVAGAVPDAPVLNTVTPASGQLTAGFTPGAVSIPATTGFTVSATPTGGGAAITQSGAASPITVTGLTNGTTYNVTVKATNANGSSAASNTVTGTPPLAPSVNVSDVSVTEGDTGTRNAVFTVSLSQPMASAVSVKYATANGTAVAPADYTAKALTALSFTAGQTSKTVAVAVKGDKVGEGNEAFSLVLSAPVGIAIGDGTGTGTIVDDDPPPPHITINDISVTEGQTGAKSAVFTVTLSNTYKLPVTMKYQTVNGTAVAPGDFTAKTPTALSFTPGTTTKTIAIALKTDKLGEPDEQFSVLLTAPVGGVLDDATGVATIVNDDPPAPNVTIGDVSIEEGNSGTKNLVFTVSLSAPAQGSVSLKYATVNGTAIAPGDYTAKALTLLSFTAGQTSKTITIAIKGDLVDEPNETFSVVLSSPTAGLNIVDGTAVGTIVDND